MELRLRFNVFTKKFPRGQVKRASPDVDKAKIGRQRTAESGQRPGDLEHGDGACPGGRLESTSRARSRTRTRHQEHLDMMTRIQVKPTLTLELVLA